MENKGGEGDMDGARVRRVKGSAGREEVNQAKLECSQSPVKF